MDMIKGLIDLLKKRLPGVILRVDEPLLKTGVWHIDATQGERSVCIQWSPQMGFGVSTDPNPGLGEGPEEIYADLDKTVNRVVQIFGAPIDDQS
jgi:hypothetical protein